MHCRQRFGDGRRALFAALLSFAILVCGARAEGPEQRTVTVLHTSDLHGHLVPWDYMGRQPADLGLAAAAGVVAAERAIDPDLLLLDGGDTIQGSPIMALYNVRRLDEPHPMAVVMNAMGYKAMVIGNHEFNFDQPVLDKFIADAEFPVLSANIVRQDGTPRYTQFVLEEVKGVTLGIVGLTTPGILVWENPSYIRDLTFVNVLDCARRQVAAAREAGAAVVMALCHSGLGSPNEDYTVPEDLPDTGPINFVKLLAEQVAGIDVILAGHTHTAIPELLLNGVLIVQPREWGRGVSRVRITVGPDNKILRKEGAHLPVSREQTDPAILTMARRYHEDTMAFLNSRAGEARGAFPGGPEARLRDGPLGDLLNAVQFEMARPSGIEPDASLATIFNDNGRLDPGPIQVAELHALYPYRNTLTLLEINGDILRRAIEHGATYWRRWDPENPPRGAEELVKPSAKPWHWDVYSGIDYTLDLTRPEGQRVTRLELGGQPVTPDRKLVLAVNNYRAGGGSGYAMFREGKVLWESDCHVRDFLIDYVRAHSPLDPATYFVPNWQIVPQLPQEP